MNFKQLLNEGKYLVPLGAKCGYCKFHLKPRKLAENKNHIYNPGLLYACFCEKSRIWANSVRNIENLIKFYNGEIDKYRNGFCNDMYCGYLEGHSSKSNKMYLYPLENGADLDGKRYDRYGCEQHEENQEIYIDSFAFLDEGEEDKLIKLYFDYKEELNKFVT